MPTNLVRLVDELAAACEREEPDLRQRIQEACRTARETTGGAIQELSTGLLHRVYPGGAKDSVQELRDQMNGLSPSDVRKWAALLLLAHAALGPSDAADDEEIKSAKATIKARAFDLARGLVDRVVELSAGNCPPAAAPLGRALVDAILHEPACEHEPSLQARLVRARSAFGAWGAGGSHSQRMSQLFDMVIECFDRNGWVHHADPGKRMTLVGFHCPIGTTELVASIPAPDRLVVVALGVLPSVDELLETAKGLLEQQHPGLELHHQAGYPVYLEANCVVGDAPLTADQVHETIVRVNGAAETLLMLRLTWESGRRWQA